MPSLRIEIEQTMGLKFPEHHGELQLKFEESVEVPRAAEILMKGLYVDPEGVKKSFQTMHHETNTLLDIIMPRKSRLREWSEDLPERPLEAEQFLKQTSEQILEKEQRIIQIEKDLLNHLDKSGLNDLFPVPLSAFAVLSYKEPSVKIFVKPITRLAELLELNPEILRQTVRVHFLFFLLLVSGLDLDGRSYIRGDEEGVVQAITTSYTLRYLKEQSTEYSLVYQEWLKAWGNKNPYPYLRSEQGAEKIRTAMVFWRRQANISWEKCWSLANQFDETKIQELNPLFEHKEPF